MNFRYLLLYTDKDGSPEHYDNGTGLQKANGTGGPPDIGLIEQLNELGFQGWELSGTMPRERGHILIFKQLAK